MLASVSYGSADNSNGSCLEIYVGIYIYTYINIQTHSLIFIHAKNGRVFA